MIHPIKISRFYFLILGLLGCTCSLFANRDWPKITKLEDGCYQFDGVIIDKKNLQNTLKEKGLPWEKAKAFDGAAVIGNFLSKSDFKDIDNINFRLLCDFWWTGQMIADELALDGRSSYKSTYKQADYSSNKIISNYKEKVLKSILYFF